VPDVIWRRADGKPPESHQWHDSEFRCLGVELRTSTLAPQNGDVVFAIFNMGPEQPLTLPATIPAWQRVLDTTRPDAEPAPVLSGLMLSANSVSVFIPDPNRGPT
jgi:glycogen operon protein